MIMIMAGNKNRLPAVFRSCFNTLWFLLCCQSILAAKENKSSNFGKWKLLLNNTGVVAMHMVLTHHNTVIMIDQIRSGTSGYRMHRVSNRTNCKRNRHRSRSRGQSCFAYSVEYDILENKIRPLNLESDPLCSSGSILGNGAIIQTGGHGSGYQAIRYFNACGDSSCDWAQSRTPLSDDRWYASSLRLPEDDRVIVVGGRGAFSYEFVPQHSFNDKSFNLPFLHKTYDRNGGGNNLYPILHLSPDGNLFIFANRDSILFDYKRRKVVKTFPQIPGNASRSYPSTGSSVLLPLHYINDFEQAEVMVCGGAAPGALAAARRGRFLKGLSSCGRMVITGDKNTWEMEEMPRPRLMSDMLILQTGQILIINGAKKGCAGLNNADASAHQPYLYEPDKSRGRRFTRLRSTGIARMYHSSAVVLPDGRVLVAGSNPNQQYTFRDASFPTELRLQAFAPPHMNRIFDHRRPHNVSIYYSRGEEEVPYGEEFSVHFWLREQPGEVLFHVYAPPFTTHSIPMNQRMLSLQCKGMAKDEKGRMNALLLAPPSPNVAPAGYYLLTVVNEGIPSKSQWIRFTNTT